MDVYDRRSQVLKEVHELDNIIKDCVIAGIKDGENEEIRCSNKYREKLNSILDGLKSLERAVRKDERKRITAKQKDEKEK